MLACLVAGCVQNTGKPAYLDPSKPLEERVEDALSRMSLEEQFTCFYQEQQNELPDGDQEALVRKIIEQQSRKSGSYVLDAKSVPQADSEELLEYLLQTVTEDEP